MFANLDVLTKQEMIAELVQNLYGGLKVSKETGAEKEGRYASKVAGSFQNAACFTTHTNSWLVFYLRMQIIKQIPFSTVIYSA